MKKKKKNKKKKNPSRKFKNTLMYRIFKQLSGRSGSSIRHPDPEFGKIIK